MLLLEPLSPSHTWIDSTGGSPWPEEVHSRNLVKYKSLTLSPGKITSVVAHLTRGLERCVVGPESLHVIVERELSETEFEPTEKVAQLVVLCALANSLKPHMAIATQTENLLRVCRELISAALMLAIDDHNSYLGEPVKL